jgi:transposase
MSQITVLTGPERRRRWSDEQRFSILAEAFASGACVADVARRHDVSTGLIYTWRRKLRRELPGPAASTSLATGFAEAVLTDEPEPKLRDRCSAIVIDLPGGGRVSISASAPAALAAAALKALR